jgi:TPR repeat protein
VTGHSINWNPLVRRDFEGFKKLAMEIEDPSAREKALLKAGGLVDALMGELVRIGYFTDPESVSYAIDKYKAAIDDGLELELRKKLFEEVSTFTKYFEDCTALTYVPFVLGDPDRGIVSTATLDYVSAAKIEEGADPMLVPRHVVRMIEGKHPVNRGAVFGGLLCTGDSRVCSGLLWDLRHQLSEDEINEACLCYTGFIGSAAVDFYLKWLEEIVSTGQNSLFGKLASGLALSRRNVQTEFVFTGERPFPYASAQGEELVAILKPMPIDDFTRQIAPRMLQLSNLEDEPKVMPQVLRVWSICTLSDAKGILISDDLIERCWELIDGPRKSEPTVNDALCDIIDISISVSGDFTLATKIGEEITRRGMPSIWDFVFSRGDAAITNQRCDGPNGAAWGQIIAMPVVCDTDITDEQIVEICKEIPPLPDGQEFKFCPVIMTWSNLNRIASTRLLHAILQNWRAVEDKQTVESDITIYAEATREETALDQVVFQRNQISKLRFLVGYRFETEDFPDYSQEQKAEWSYQANEALQSVCGDKSFAVRSPRPLGYALYSAQSIMTELNAKASVWIAERYHSPVSQDKFGIRLVAYGNLYNGLADCFEATAYDLENGETIFRREIPIAHPSVRPRWKQELDHLRVNLEAGGCPYVAVAPILQSIYLNDRVFEETKCVKVTLGAPTSLGSSVEDGHPFENISEIAEEKQRWLMEGERLHVEAEKFRSTCAGKLGLDIETVRSSGEFSLIKGRWFPTIIIFLRNAKAADGSPIDWPVDANLVDSAVKWAAAETGRRWADWTFGGVPTESEEVDVEAVYKLALNGDLAAQVQLARILYRGEKVEQNRSTALQWFRKAALQGDGESQVMVAYMLDEGNGCAQNEVEGLHWHRLAAENGSSYSQRKLAAAYEAGELVRQDYAEAAKWYRLAANQGSADAQFSLGWLLYSGNGVPENPEEAAEYFERSARRGNAAAQYNIGAMYRNGEHGPVDRVKSYAWLRLAAEQEYEGAEDGLEEICPTMSVDEIAKGKELAKEFAAVIAGQR